MFGILLFKACASQSYAPEVREAWNDFKSWRDVDTVPRISTSGWNRRWFAERERDQDEVVRPMNEKAEESDDDFVSEDGDETEGLHRGSLMEDHQGSDRSKLRGENSTGRPRQILQEEEEKEESEEDVLKRLRRKKRMSLEALPTGRAKGKLLRLNLPSLSRVSTNLDDEEEESGRKQAMTASTSATNKRWEEEMLLLHDIAVALRPPVKSAEEIEMEKKRLDFEIEQRKVWMKLATQAIELATKLMPSYLNGASKQKEKE